jgi:kynurenine formamidase
MSLTDYRLVDLTHTIHPETGARPVHIEQVDAPHAVPGGQWYIMHRVDMTLNHVGTHIEAPYHVREKGMDVADVPLERLCGDAIVLNLTGVAPGHVVSEDDVRQAAKQAGGIRSGDMVFCRFDYDYEPTSNRPFSAEAIAYLVNAGMKLMGVDLLGIELPDEDPRAPEQYNHHQLLDNDICLVEQVAHLNRLSQPRFQAVVMPIPIKGLDSFPVRVVAFEG